MAGGDAVFSSVLGVFRHVASLCLKCFSCFRCIFQVFHMDVAKVDRDVTYVVVAARVCCKRLSQCFIYFFIRMMQVCLFGCCICFTHMLQVFYLDVAYVFAIVSSVFRCFYKCFRCMFQVFHLL